MDAPYRKSKLNMIQRALRTRFRGEAPTVKFIRQLNRPGTTMLDIGANHGDVGIYISRAAGPDGRVFSFEAQPELGPHLENVKRQFRLDNQTIINQGLSSEPGTLTMRRKKIGDGGATVTNAEKPDADDSLVVSIPMTTLDTILPELGVEHVSFIKCDVEGHELEVFRGGREMLLRDHPVLVFESHDSEIEDNRLYDFLTELGYEGYFFFVTQEDRKSLLHTTRGRYVRFEDRKDYPHEKPGMQHRNYFFVRAGTVPEDYQR
jgi:FkbM family methyltransferase